MRKKELRLLRAGVRLRVFKFPRLGDASRRVQLEVVLVCTKFTLESSNRSSYSPSSVAAF